MRQKNVIVLHLVMWKPQQRDLKWLNKCHIIHQQKKYEQEADQSLALYGDILCQEKGFWAQKSMLIENTPLF